MNVKDIVFREDLYPRFNPDQAAIQKYAHSIEFLPPIKVDQHCILIDGFHRWKAHQLAGVDEIRAEVVQVSSESELEILAFQLNAIHGLQLSADEKKKFACKMWGKISASEISKILSVDEATIYRWTPTQREAQKNEQNRKIVENYLRAWNTQEEIADLAGVSQQAVSNFTKNLQMQENGKPDPLLLYSVWNTPKQDNVVTSHFGSFPQVFMENLLYYFTDPLQVVFDPFAGGGTTVDACKKMNRRYFCSDRIVKPGREKDIIEWDITQGLPKNLRDVDFVFLDPPYWHQARGKYSSDPTDLGNMNLTEFFVKFEVLVKQLHKKNPEAGIACVMSPWKGDGKYIDLPLLCHEIISRYFTLLQRLVLPYPTQIHGGAFVEMAKERKELLYLHRDLMVYGPERA